MTIDSVTAPLSRARQRRLWNRRVSGLPPRLDLERLSRLPIETQVARSDVGARANAAKDPFLAGQSPGPRERLVVRDGLHAVQETRIEVLGDEAGANALNLVRAGVDRSGAERAAVGG